MLEGVAVHTHVEWALGVAVAAGERMEVAYLVLLEYHAQSKKSLDALNDLPHVFVVVHLDNALENIDHQKSFADDPRMEEGRSVDATR